MLSWCVGQISILTGEKTGSEKESYTPEVTELVTAHQLQAFPEHQRDLQASWCPLLAGLPYNRPRDPLVSWQYLHPHFTGEENEGQSSKAICPRLPSRARLEPGQLGDKLCALPQYHPALHPLPPEQWFPQCSPGPAAAAAPGSYQKC